MYNEISTKQIAYEMGVDIPAEFICPITQDVMCVPLMTKSGFHFEKSAITEWIIIGNGNCPLTRRPLQLSDLVPNVVLRKKIEHWRWKNLLPDSSESDYKCLQSGQQKFGIISSKNKTSLIQIGFNHNRINERFVRC